MEYDYTSSGFFCHLGCLSNLTALDVHGCQMRGCRMDDKGMAGLQHLSSLTMLSLPQCSEVTEEGYQHLRCT